MEKRLNENKHDCTVEVYTYEHGTHFCLSSKPNENDVANWS